MDTQKWRVEQKDRQGEELSQGVMICGFCCGDLTCAKRVWNQHWIWGVILQETNVGHRWGSWKVGTKWNDFFGSRCVVFNMVLLSSKWACQDEKSSHPASLIYHLFWHLSVSPWIGAWSPEKWALQPTIPGFLGFWFPDEFLQSTDQQIQLKIGSWNEEDSGFLRCNLVG